MSCGREPGTGGWPMTCTPTSSRSAWRSRPARTGPLVGNELQPASSAKASATATATRRRSDIVDLAGDRAAVGLTHCDRLGPGEVHRLERERRPFQLDPLETGQGDPELRPGARLAPRLQPAAVQVDVLQGDRQAEPGAAGRARPGRVGAPEPVEDQGSLAGTKAHAAVAYR